jgi:hypothetical protein
MLLILYVGNLTNIIKVSSVVSVLDMCIDGHMIGTSLSPNLFTTCSFKLSLLLWQCIIYFLGEL